MASKYMPINLSLKGRKVLLIGAGNVALRKIETLLDYEAEITVIALQPIERIDYYGSKEIIKLEEDLKQHNRDLVERLKKIVDYNEKQKIKDVLGAATVGRTGRGISAHSLCARQNSRHG